LNAETAPAATAVTMEVTIGSNVVHLARPVSFGSGIAQEAARLPDGYELRVICSRDATGRRVPFSPARPKTETLAVRDSGRVELRA
jgi:hypothetical protein